MSDFKYTLEKNKQKIFIGLSALGLGVVGVGVYFLVNSVNHDVPTEETPIIVDSNNVKANFIIGADTKGNIDLISLESNEVVKTKTLDKAKNVMYSRSNDLEKVLALNNGVFVSIIEEKGELVEKVVFDLNTDKEILDFKFSDKYIVSRAEDVLLVSSVEDKETFEIEVKDVDAYLVIEDKLVYAETENVHTYDLKTKENKEINLGAVTKALVEHDENVIVFNEFGAGKEKSTILNIKSNDLYIESAHRHDNKNLIPVANDSDDSVISYLDESDNAKKILSHYQLSIDEKGKETKSRADLTNASFSDGFKFTEDNSVSTKGYLYTTDKGEIKIIRLSGEVVDSTIKTDKTFFMPISIENNID